VVKFLLVEEVAKKLRLHPNTIRKYIKERKLPAAKFGKVYRIKDEDTEKFIQKAMENKR